MADEYKDFKKEFLNYVRYSQAYSQAHGGNSSQEIADIASSLYEAKPERDYVRTIQDSRVLAGLLQVGAEQKMKKAKSFSENNLEKIVGGMPKAEMGVALEIAKPKDNYTGAKAGVYNEIRESKKDLENTMQQFSTKDYKKIKQEIKKFYEAKDDYKGDKKADQRELLYALIDLDQNFVNKSANTIVKEKKDKFDAKLKGNEAGYLAETLKGEDFLEFYTQLLAQIEELKKRSQKEE
ncbi:MAG: hypothetical protein ACP5OG_03920 [Candidatus Nanoarchaeia archaeon]